MGVMMNILTKDSKEKIEKLVDVIKKSNVVHNNSHNIIDEKGIEEFADATERDARARRELSKYVKQGCITWHEINDMIKEK